MYRRRRTRIALLVAAASALVALTAGIARAVFPADSVASYAGCLNGPGAGPLLAGWFSNIAVGDVPLHACSRNQTLVHLSGGDITSVNAGAGLAGGGTNGATALSVAPSYALPQGCSNNFVPKWISSSSTWGCAADDNTGGTISGVTAGTGLTGGGANGSVSLGLAPGYQLPQSCASSQVAKADGSGGWSCGDDNTGAAAAGLHVYYVHVHDAGNGLPRVDFGHYPGNVSILTLDLPAGMYLLQAHVNVFFLTSDLFPPDPFVDCQLEGPSGVFDSNSTTVSRGSGYNELALDGTVTLASPGSIHLECDYENATLPDNTELFPWDKSMTAIPLSGLN